MKIRIHVSRVSDEFSGDGRVKVDGKNARIATKQERSSVSRHLLQWLSDDMALRDRTHILEERRAQQNT